MAVPAVQPGAAEGLVAAYLAAGAARGLSAGTIDTYRWALARLPAAPWTAASLERALGELPLAPQSKHGLFRFWRVFFRWLEERHGLPSPLARVAAPVWRRRLPVTVPRGQLRRLVESAGSRRDRALLLLLLDTGVRIGEAWALRPEDLRPGSIVVTGKTGQREVPVSRAVQLEVLPYLPWGVSRHWLKRIVTGYLRSCGVTRGGPHALRHTFATEFIRAGGDVFSLQRILGHASVSTTMVYVHLAVGDLQAQHARYSPALALVGQAAS